MGHLGAGWLERPTREQEEQPRKAIELMELKPTDVVADIGAGTGYFSFRIAAKVPQGKVLAVDIQPEMLDDDDRRPPRKASPTSSRSSARSKTRSCPEERSTWP